MSAAWAASMVKKPPTGIMSTSICPSFSICSGVSGQPWSPRCASVRPSISIFMIRLPPRLLPPASSCTEGMAVTVTSGDTFHTPALSTMAGAPRAFSTKLWSPWPWDTVTASQGYCPMA